MNEKFKLVKIVWVDSGLTLDSTVWMTNDELKEEAKTSSLVITTGFVVAEDNEHLVVSHSTDGDLFRGGFRILKSCIMSIDTLGDMDVKEDLKKYNKDVAEIEKKKNETVKKAKKNKKKAKSKKSSKKRK